MHPDYYKALLTTSDPTKEMWELPYYLYEYFISLKLFHNIKLKNIYPLSQKLARVVKRLHTSIRTCSVPRIHIQSWMWWQAQGWERMTPGTCCLVSLPNQEETLLQKHKLENNRGRHWYERPHICTLKCSLSQVPWGTNHQHSHRHPSSPLQGDSLNWRTWRWRDVS